VKIIIDTHIFLWLALGEYEKIKAMNHLEDTGNDLFISSLSIAEISIKVSVGKLKFDGDILAVLEDMDIEVLNFDAKSALLLQSLPFHHKDPFDRMIIAQSISNKFKIISVDKNFKKYDCELI